MKLIFCPRCQDVVRLFDHVRKCDCGLSWGHYVDPLMAEIGGDAIPLGFDNGEMTKALNTASQVKGAGRGITFAAFVIRMPCATVHRMPRKS